MPQTLLPGLSEEAAHQNREGREAGSGEERPEGGKQHGERCGKIAAREHWRTVFLSGGGVSTADALIVLRICVIFR
jgi:hypothetical protein